MKKTSLLVAATLCGSLIALPQNASAQAVPEVSAARDTEAVVLTGAQLPGWSGPAATGSALPWPSGALDGTRDAHHGRLVAPPATGAPVEDIAAYRWDGERFVEIPVQVDERFPYFLANASSDFAFYSAVDEELTYEFDTENWMKTAGHCEAQYDASNPRQDAPEQDPVATLDDDDEVVFMARDAGDQAPLEALGPAGTDATRQEIRLTDPRDPAAERFVYLFQTPGGTSFDTEHYVDYERDANADEWIDQNRFHRNDPELLGSSNTGYGPNLSGTVCGDNLRTSDVETEYASTDRFPRDGVTVTTDTYRWRASGRWMVRGMQVTKPGAAREFGPDLIDRWKGRAFQQSPDSSISLVGFEDEQVNWEGNSTLLGELTGPVRAIRETWGADSGTNVTKIETFYRDAITYRYHVRVHPIPPDGLYTSWDYNSDAVSTYFNETKTQGVPVDGVNDEIPQTQMDEAPNGDPAFFDAPDPTFTKPLSFLNWEQVSGKGDNGSLVYMFELKGATSLVSPAVMPYYRDDACLDDGTGDDPSPRAYPGESYEWMSGSSDPVAQSYVERPCKTEAPADYSGPYRQGCYGCHGIHYFVTGDTDNAFQSKPVTEIDGQQWQWAVPTSEPTNVGDLYANTVKTPLIPLVSLQPNTAGAEEPTEPEATSLTISGASTGQSTDSVTLAATLTGESGDAVAGAPVAFSLDGVDAGTATTGADGRASIDVTLSGPARDAVQSASYGGSDAHAASAATAPFSVTHEDSFMALDVTQTKGNNHTAAATLTDADSGRAIAGRDVTFLVDGREAGTVATGSGGRATLTLAKARNGATVTAIFGGDDTFLGSSATGKVLR